ncbi:AI-2E family transporter [Nannocystis bainbridge]|uniref:AI-2E family transporter n=1 Tax=Nannocystis bainbridge TaxID=2995303 RepID=A0ABT5DSI7_9BACT|nr:AI-2E family transporter [Nannocystis bainbridge]MDC0716569.1 AI-2E family transporter [Nannocystis bainbridge]
MNNSIDNREKARWIILVAALSGTLYLCWLMLVPFIDVLAWASVLTITLEPVHRRILQRTRRPNLSALLACLIVVLLIGLPLALIGWAMFREIGPAVSSLQGAVASLTDPSSATTGSAVRWLNERMDVLHIRVQVTEYLSTLGGELATRMLYVVQNAATMLVGSLLALFVMFYFFRDGLTIRDALATAIPLRNQPTRALLLRVREVVAASIYGGLVVAAIQGTLGGLAFWVLGVPSALLWGVVMIFMSLIGAFLVWVPAAIYLAIQGAWIKAILLTVWGIFAIGLIDNFLRPRLVGKRTELHELLIFFAVLGGLRLFGFVGIVLGPVVIAVALSLFEAFRHPDVIVAAPEPVPLIVPPTVKL